MKRTLVVAVLLVVVAVGTALAYQAAARQRAYRLLVARGDAALRDDQTFAAIEAYSGAIALRPDSMLAHLRLGETYQRRGDLQEAAREFRAASGLDPTATRPLEELGDAEYQLQRYGLAVQAYEQCFRLDDRAARVSYKLALARFRDGKLNETLGAIALALRLDPRMADAYYLRGLCLREQHRAAEALAALEKAASLAPGSIPIREELADLYGALGRHSEELDQLQVLAGLDHDHVERQVAIGLAHTRAGHADLAVVTLGSALERTPNHPLLYGALGQVWLDFARIRGDRVYLNKALEALERVASTTTPSSTVLTLYGRALLQDGNAEAAERVLEQATERYPVEPASFLLYAAAAERAKHLGAARQALIAYGGLMPDDPDLAVRAGRIAALSLRLNDADAAVEWFGRAAAASPNDIRILASLADAQIRAGAPDAARATITSGLDKDPTNPQLLNLKGKLHSSQSRRY